MGTRGSLLSMLLIAAGPVCGLAATDLILPAIPMLPSVLDGTAEVAQWVLAAFALGTGVGLLIFGELGSRYRIIDILVFALFAFAGLSLVATLTGSLVEMSIVRFFQGLAASAPAVYAPVMVKRLFSEARAVVMIGRIGSIESMAPAIAPIIGAALLSLYGWQSSFYVVAVVATGLAVIWLSTPRLRSGLSRLDRSEDGYFALLRDATFLRYAISQACTLGALLIIVFAAPKVITSSLGGNLSDFIVMQVLGITFFVIAANMTGTFTRWWGDENSITIGSALTGVGCVAILIMAASGIRSIPLLWTLFALVNLGLGVRGPVGFYKALMAAGSNESRGSGLVVFFVMLVTAVGTAAVAPFIEVGLLPVAIVAAATAVASVLFLSLIRPLSTVPRTS